MSWNYRINELTVDEHELSGLTI